MAATVDTAANPQEPVPLDTIPISPEGGNMNGTKDGEAGSVPYNDSEPVTVFHDPNNFNVKHPLMNAWTLWFTKPPSGKVCSRRASQSCGDIVLTHGSLGRQLERAAEGGHFVRLG